MNSSRYDEDHRQIMELIEVRDEGFSCHKRDASEEFLPAVVAD